MNGAEATKTVKESRVILAQHMGLSDSNLAGAVHGGAIMKLVDTAGALAAMKFSGQPVVTAAIDELSFLEPVNLGDLVTVTASVNGVGDTSMEVGVKVETENVLTGEKRHTSTAYLLYVALDPESKQPVRVPRLECETTEERRRQRQAKARRKARNARREASLAARAGADEAARRRQEASEARRQARLAAKAQKEQPTAAETPAAPAEGPGDVRKWRPREPEPALVGASVAASQEAADLSKWRRQTR
ncbi:MAG TPA: acyl-CoA thioesterase [Actinomycetota bacterium]|nr:acyl-CoA thioesterase [Actinomycetota bacterium]